MDNLSKYEIMESMASRRKEMEALDKTILEYKKVIKQMEDRREQLKNLNFLDAILLKELEDDGSNKK